MRIEDLYPEINQEVLEELVSMARSLSSQNMEESVLEKDLFLTGMLRKVIIESPERDLIYFKGGTALSKCHGLVSRFSEDCDLFVYTGNPSGSKKQEKKLNERVTHFIEEAFDGLLLDGSKRGGYYNDLKFSYEGAHKDERHKPFVEFEISGCALVDKTDYHISSIRKRIQPLIGSILEANGYSEIVNRFGLSAFEVDCLTPEKTLCDKVSRMIRVSYGEAIEEDLAKYIRDTYDIAMMLNNPEMKAYFNSERFLWDMYMVNREDRLRNNSHAEEPYSGAALFKEPERYFDLPTIHRAYDDILDSFIFSPESAPSVEDIKSVFASMHPVMELFDEFRQLYDQGIKTVPFETLDKMQKEMIVLIGRIDGAIEVGGNSYVAEEHSDHKGVILLQPVDAVRAKIIDAELTEKEKGELAVGRGIYGKDGKYLVYSVIKERVMEGKEYESTLKDYLKKQEAERLQREIKERMHQDLRPVKHLKNT